jgi:glucose/arabinose dehydrogenase
MVMAASCSIPSFEERQAALDEQESQQSTRPDASSGDEPDELVRGPVMLEADPEDDLDDPSWADLPLVTVVVAQYEEPISLTSRSGSNDLYVAQRNGIIRRIQRTFNKDGVERIAADTRVVLDLSANVSTSGEQGLLDIEFSLDGRLLYVSYTDLDGSSVVAEYNIARSTQANANSGRELLRIPQPASNHNGGSLVMGADGFLYLGLGDGGGSGDPDGNGQNTDTLLGSILRIDPIANETGAYMIPDGNPFVDGGGRPEIFLYGVRNPWRFSFDLDTGDMWIADVGQNAFEEINHLTASDGFGRGANLGWNAVEAFDSFEGRPPPQDTTAPIFAYSHENGRCSITGGHVYRGQVIPLLDGVYVFGDYCSGEVFGLAPGPEPVVRPLSFEAPDNQLVSIGQGPDGELYLVLSGGEIARVQPGVADAE